ncbi:hypothetical protein BH10ACT1_BH10ACT1_33360 [soil metagenome]
MDATSSELAAVLVPLPDRAVYQDTLGLTHWLMPGEVGNLTFCGYRSDGPSFAWYEADPRSQDCPSCLAAHELAADLTARSDASNPDVVRQVGAAYLLAAHHIDGGA